MVYDNYLKHYGVLGMKWGISRSKEVRGAKKEHKKRMKEFHADVGKFGQSLTDGYNSHRAQRRLAIKEAKRSGDKAQVQRVKEHFKNEYKKMDQHFKNEAHKLQKREVDLKSARKQNIKEAKEKAANRLFRDGDSARNKRIANASLGKSLVQTLLMGSYGAKKYNQHRSEGHGRASSYVNGTLWNVANVATAGAANRVSNGAAISNWFGDRRRAKQAKRK